MKSNLFLFLIIFLFSTKDLFACKCQDLKGYNESEFVYEGKIIEKRYFLITKTNEVEVENFMEALKYFIKKDTLVVTRFTIENIRVFKGKASNKKYLYTAAMPAHCGLGRSFEINDTILVFGKKESPYKSMSLYNKINYPIGDDLVWTHSCTETKISTEENIKYIEELSKNKN